MRIAGSSWKRMYGEIIMYPTTKPIRYFYGWLFIRPRRWVFNKMGWASTGLRWKPEKDWNNKWIWPNPHWWILYKTVYKFCKWLEWDGWRPFAVWGEHRLKKHTFISKFLKWIGETTTGYYYRECYHCAAKGCAPVELSNGEPENEDYFILKDSGSSYIPGEGTDHWFHGITICPKCGYRQEYGDGSL